MAVIVPFIPLILGAVGAVGAVASAQTASNNAKYSAKVAQNQAEANNSAATAAVEQQRAQARAAIGRQLAATAQSGTGLNGSNLDLLNESLYNSESDSLNIRYRGDMNSSGLNAQAQLYESKASSAMAGGYLSAAGSLIGGYGTYTSRGTTVPKGG